MFLFWRFAGLGYWIFWLANFRRRVWILNYRFVIFNAWSVFVQDKNTFATILFPINAKQICRSRCLNFILANVVFCPYFHRRAVHGSHPTPFWIFWIVVNLNFQSFKAQLSSIDGKKFKFLYYRIRKWQLFCCHFHNNKLKIELGSVKIEFFGNVKEMSRA